jgi:hypothetical protein
MRFILGLLFGYCIRGKKPLLIATLTTIAVVCFIVLPAIALSQLALSVRRERLSRPPQTSAPVVIGLNYETAQTKLRDATLNIRVLATRYDLPVEPGIVIAQTPQSGERVDCGSGIGVTVSSAAANAVRWNEGLGLALSMGFYRGQSRTKGFIPFFFEFRIGLLDDLAFAIRLGKRVNTRCGYVLNLLRNLVK